MCMEQVHCPHCGKKYVPVIEGSTCHCECGTVFVISGKSDRQLRIEVRREVTSPRPRRQVFDLPPAS
jgi:uncharacterized Zn finger protein